MNPEDSAEAASTVAVVEVDVDPLSVVDNPTPAPTSQDPKTKQKRNGRYWTYTIVPATPEKEKSPEYVEPGPEVIVNNLGRPRRQSSQKATQSISAFKPKPKGKAKAKIKVVVVDGVVAASTTENDSKEEPKDTGAILEPVQEEHLPSTEVENQLLELAIDKHQAEEAEQIPPVPVPVPVPGGKRGRPRKRPPAVTMESNDLTSVEQPAVDSTSPPAAAAEPNQVIDESNTSTVSTSISDDDNKQIPTNEEPPPPTSNGYHQVDEPIAVTEDKSIESAAITSPTPSFQLLLENTILCDDALSRECKAIRCTCAPTKEELRQGRGCGEDCINRLLFMECKQCPSGKRCSNKRFQNRQYADVEAFHAGAKGWGLKAKAPIPKDSFIIEYTGEVVDAEEMARRTRRYGRDPNHTHHYLMALRNGAVIDATRKGNPSRLINHSCNPNAATQKWTVNQQLRIGFFALRAIEAGEELTFNYKFERYGRKAQKCYCGSKNCTGYIGENNEDGDADSDGGGESGDEEDTSSLSEDDLSTKINSPVPKSIASKSVAGGGPKKKVMSAARQRRQLELEKERKLRQEVAEVNDLLRRGTLRNKEHVLEFNRLMVRVDHPESRQQMVEFLLSIECPDILRLFVNNQGLALIRIWFMLPDFEQKALRMQDSIVRLLLRLPVASKNQVDDANLMSTLKQMCNSELPVSIVVRDVVDDLLNEVCLQAGEQEASSSSPDDDDILPLPNPIIELHRQLKDNVAQLLEKWSALSQFKIPKKGSGGRGTNHSSNGNGNATLPVTYHPHQHKPWSTISAVSKPYKTNPSMQQCALNRKQSNQDLVWLSPEYSNSQEVPMEVETSDEAVSAGTRKPDTPHSNGQIHPASTPRHSFGGGGTNYNRSRYNNNHRQPPLHHYMAAINGMVNKAHAPPPVPTTTTENGIVEAVEKEKESKEKGTERSTSPRHKEHRQRWSRSRSRDRSYHYHRDSPAGANFRGRRPQLNNGGGGGFRRYNNNHYLDGHRRRSGGEREIRWRNWRSFSKSPLRDGGGAKRMSRGRSSSSSSSGSSSSSSSSRSSSSPSRSRERKKRRHSPSPPIKTTHHRQKEPSRIKLALKSSPDADNNNATTTTTKSPGIAAVEFGEGPPEWNPAIILQSAETMNNYINSLKEFTLRLEQFRDHKQPNKPSAPTTPAAPVSQQSNKKQHTTPSTSGGDEPMDLEGAAHSPSPTTTSSSLSITTALGVGKFLTTFSPVKEESIAVASTSESLLLPPANKRRRLDVGKPSNNEGATPPEDPALLNLVPVPTSMVGVETENGVEDDVTVGATDQQHKEVSQVMTKSGNWLSAKDSQGTIYYYHRQTLETTWDLPPGEEIIETQPETKIETQPQTKTQPAAPPSDSNQPIMPVMDPLKKRKSFKEKVSELINKRIQPYYRRFFHSNEEFILFLRKSTRKVVENNVGLEFNDSVQTSTNKLVDEYIAFYKDKEKFSQPRAPPPINKASPAKP